MHVVGLVEIFVVIEYQYFGDNVNEVIFEPHVLWGFCLSDAEQNDMSDSPCHISDVNFSLMVSF